MIASDFKTLQPGRQKLEHAVPVLILWGRVLQKILHAGLQTYQRISRVVAAVCRNTRLHKAYRAMIRPVFTAINSQPRRSNLPQTLMLSDFFSTEVRYKIFCPLSMKHYRAMMRRIVAAATSALLP